MLRNLGVVCGLALICLSVSPAAMAADAAVPADVAATMKASAVQACNDAIDHNRFEDYTSLDECVSDKVEHMQHAYKANPVAFQASLKQPKR